MIVKGFRIPTSESLGRLRNHVFRGEENSEVRVLRGTEADLSDFRDLAVAKRASFALRHFIIAPEMPMTDADLFAVVDDLAAEFGFDPQICVAILHRKPRRVGEAETHLHVIVPEVDAATGNILSSSHDYVRHEKLARIVEHRHGHPFVEGAHIPAVLAALRQERRQAVHDALTTAFPTHARPIEAFSTINARRVARETGIDLADLKVELRKLRGSGASPEAVAVRLAEQGISLAIGDKPGTIVLSTAGVHVAALHRLIGLKKEAVYREFNLVAADIARRPISEPPTVGPEPAAKPRSPDSARDAGDPVVDRGDGRPHEPRHRRRRSGSGDPGHADQPSQSRDRPQGERGGPPYAPRQVDAARARRRKIETSLRARADEATLVRLTEERRLAAALAVSAPEAAADWLDGVEKALEAEGAALHSPHPARSEVLAKATRDEATMRDVNAAHQRDIDKLTAAITEKEVALRTSWLVWRRRQASSPELDKLRRELKEAKDRLAACEEDRQRSENTCREERRDLANRAENERMMVPYKLAEIVDRKKTIDFIRKELAAYPWMAFGGVVHLRRLFDQIISEPNQSCSNDHLADKKKRGPWIIEQSKKFT